MARSPIERNPWSDADVERHWDRVAERYVEENRRVGPAHAQRFEVAVPLLGLAPGLRVLNVSSRDCEADDHIRRACAEVEIVHAEISQGLIDVARRLRPSVRPTKIETYSKLPFGDEEFDRVLSLETLEHVAEPLEFLRELLRTARGGSFLVLSCPPATAEIPYRAYTLLFGGHGEGPHRFLPSSSVKALLEKAGWRLESHRGTLLVPLGPRFLRELGERFIERHQGTFVSELGIRQFYVCRKP